MKNIDVEKRISTLDIKINKRPTFTQAIMIAGICISLLTGAITFVMSNLLNTQSAKINAETKLVIVEAIQEQEEKDIRKWAERKESIIHAVMVKLGLR